MSASLRSPRKLHARENNPGCSRRCSAIGISHTVVLWIPLFSFTTQRPCWVETVRVHSSRGSFQVFLLHKVSSALGTAKMSCGYRYTVIASTQDTKGEYLKVQEYIRPGMPGTPRHRQRCSADMQVCTDVCCAFLLIKPCNISCFITCSHDASTS